MEENAKPKDIIVFENRCDEPFRIFGGGQYIGTIRTIESGGDKRVLEIIRLDDNGNECECNARAILDIDF